MTFIEYVLSQTDILPETLLFFFFSFGSHKDERDMTSTGHISSSEAYKEKNSKPSTRNLGQQLSYKKKKKLVGFGMCV